MGSQQVFVAEESRNLTNVLTRSLRLLGWKETLRRQRPEYGDQSEVLAIIPVRDVNILDQVGTSETRDKLSSSVCNFTFGCLSSLDFPALILSFLQP